jgi:hypothetical protein
MDDNDTRKLTGRLQREFKTVDAMIAVFCKKHHKSQNICENCRKLRDYAIERLEKCPFGNDKPTCAKCPVHCYKPVMRERIREMMRFSGPRMIYRHPIMAMLHLLDKIKTR